MTPLRRRFNSNVVTQMYACEETTDIIIYLLKTSNKCAKGTQISEKKKE